MKTIAITNYKGGVGKTVTAVNLAYNLAAGGRRILLVDADPQAYTSYMMRQYERKASLCGVLTGKPIKKAIFKAYEKLYILPASSDLEAVEGIEPDTLKNKLSELSEYDYCIIDCNSSMQIFTINALTAADYVITPFKPDQFSVKGLTMFQDYLFQISEYNPDIVYMGALAVMYRGTKSQKDILEEILAENICPIMDTFIADREAVNTSIRQRKPLSLHRKKDTATADYLELTLEVIERLEG